MSPILAVRNLEKTYPNGVQALKNVSFEVDRGEFLAVVGSSGSGKSTLLRCLNRLHDPTAGEISFEDHRIDRYTGEQVFQLRRDMAMIFQGFNLIPRHSVFQNVLMGRLAYTPTIRSLFGMFSTEDRKLAMEHLNLVGIADKANVRADQLSGGQQQRVSIARALTQKPKLLLADEPVASLDPESRKIVMDYLRKANREMGITVICSLHSVDLVHEYSTRFVALKSGRLICTGKPTDLTEANQYEIYR